MSTLVNKSYKDYDYVSRYAQFPYYYHRKDNKYVYGITSYLDDTTIFKIHIVKQGDTLDKLALYYYNNPTLYWVICSFNHIKDPFTQLTTGQEIKIPSLANVKFDMLGRSVL